eukprot:13141111-Ditylum_brightwellii.AAC.1
MIGHVVYCGDRCVEYGIEVGDHVGTINLNLSSHVRYVKVPSSQSLFPLYVIGGRADTVTERTKQAAGIVIIKSSATCIFRTVQKKIWEHLRELHAEAKVNEHVSNERKIRTYQSTYVALEISCRDLEFP